MAGVELGGRRVMETIVPVGRSWWVTKRWRGVGTGLAIAGAWGVIKALGTEVTAFTVPPTQVGVIVALAALAGIGAALGPARRAAKLDVLDGIASQ